MEIIDLRWLALLFIVIAFGELLVCPESCSRERQRDCEEASLHFYWAARKAVVVAPTFSGESSDLVRAGILITRYLVHQSRISESWLTGSFAVRMAQAQGMHIDGANWQLPRKVLEKRRRLWATLYNLDRTICLALGRPYTIHEKHCTEVTVPNIWVDLMTSDEAKAAQPQDVLDPTPGIYYQFHQPLSKILGQIHDECFGVSQPNTSHVSYDKILAFDKDILAWKDTLPPYFRLENPDVSMDELRPYLYWQRLYLHSAYHFARITLHRKYVFLPSVTDRFRYSREACISSACADLGMKLQIHRPTMADTLKFHLSTSKFFSSALVLSIMAVRDPLSRTTEAIMGDLKAYCDKQKADSWVNDFELAEIKVVELCIANVSRSRRESRAQVRPELLDGPSESHRQVQHTDGRHQEWPAQANTLAMPDYNMEEFVSQITSGAGIDSGSDFGRDLLDLWFGPGQNFLDFSDTQPFQ